MSKPPVHIMVDLETMGNRPDAPITSIGAVVFHNGAPVPVTQRETFLVNVALESYDRPLPRQWFRFGGDTVKFWLQQSDGARQAMLGNATTLEVALDAFSGFVRDMAEQDLTRVRMWGNGAAFDNVILRYAYEVFGVVPPWAFWNDRCYRTIKNLAREIPAPKRGGTEHVSVDDAKHQAAHLLQITDAKGINLNNL